MSERVTVSYIPAIHRGYIDFVEQYPGRLFILDEDIIETIPKLDRDIRAMRPSDVVKSLGSLGIARSVSLLNENNLDDVRDTFDSYVMPDESANREFAERNLDQRHTIDFVQAFLRWDMKASLQQVPLEHELHQPNEQESRLMELARLEASKSPDWWRQVGAAVITENDEVLLGHNTHFPSPDYSLNTFGDPRANFDAGEHIEVSKAVHAEAKIIANAAKKGIALEGASIFVTTFPCPNCAKLIAESGMGQVFYENGYSVLDAVDTLAHNNVSISRIVSPDAG